MKLQWHGMICENELMVSGNEMTMTWYNMRTLIYCNRKWNDNDMAWHDMREWIDCNRKWNHNNMTWHEEMNCASASPRLFRSFIGFLSSGA